MTDEMDKRDRGGSGDEPPPTAAEQEQAARLAGALDRLLAGEAPGEADDELTAARMLRAAKGREPGLDPAALKPLLDSAMEQTDRDRRRRRGLRRAAPLAAMAAAVMLVVTALLLAPALVRMDEPAAPLALETLSRSGDALLARPFADRGAASSRLDRVFADRMRGYRKVALAMGSSR